MSALLRVHIVTALSLIVAATFQAGHADNTVKLTCVLYSWPTSSGDWEYSLRVGPSGRTLYAEEVFDKKSVVLGTRNLKRKFTQLPSGTLVHWLKHIDPQPDRSTTQSAKLSYPPPETIREINDYAAAHGVKLEVDADRHE